MSSARTGPRPPRTVDEIRRMASADNGTPGTPDELITAHLDLVAEVLRPIASRLPSHVSREDLHGAGAVGLVQAAAAYRHERGVPFANYAAVRIRGAIIEELRACDWLRRTARDAVRRVAQAEEVLTAALDRQPTSGEIASFVGCSAAEVVRLQAAADGVRTLSLDVVRSAALEPVDMSSEGCPEGVLLEAEQRACLLAAVEALPPRLRDVVVLHYLQHQPLTAIAARLGLADCTVSQLRGKAVEVLRDGMNSQLWPEKVRPVGTPGGVVERRRQAYLDAVAHEMRARA